MTRLQYLLTKLAEECSEVAQMALKSQQFGLEEKRAGQDLTNKERLHEELNDLNGIVRMLNREFGFGFVPSGIAATAKCEKVNKYYALSKKLGQVE